MSEIARRAIKTVKNQEKWPKIGIEEPEGWSKVSKIDRNGLILVILLFRKNKLYKLSKNISAHDLHALMSGRSIAEHFLTRS